MIPPLKADYTPCDPHATGRRGVSQTASRAIIAGRKRMGLTQGALALEAGISRSRMNKIESGQESGLHFRTAILIARALAMRSDGLEGYDPHPALSPLAAAFFLGRLPDSV